MVSEPAVIDELVEQVSDDAPQAEVAAPVEPEMVTTEVDAPSDGAVVATEAMPEEIVETTEIEVPSEPESVDQLLERYPQLTERLETERHAGAQAREAEIRRDAGDLAQTRAASREFLRNAGVDPDSIEDQKALDYIHNNALAHQYDASRLDLGRGVLAAYVVDPAERERQQASLSRLTGEALNTEVSGLFDVAVKSTTARVLSELDGSDVSAEVTPKLYKWLHDERDRMVTAELAARTIEANPPKEPAPATTVGTTVGAEGPTRAQYSAASPSQRREWRKQGVEVQLE